MRKFIYFFVAILIIAGAVLTLLYSMEWSRKYVVEYRLYLEKLDRMVRYQLYLPLRGTPDFDRLDERLKERGLALGDPIFVRIFKEEHVLELWMKKGDQFELFASYPICMFSGRIGPKKKEGDRQSPEGFYTVGKDQLNPNSRWYRSFNLGYPNAFDKSHGRTGSFLMVHGGCASIGCYAMTNPAMKEIWTLVTAALDKGQENFSVQAFPFRMTDWNMTLHERNSWSPFWRDLKKGYDLFEQTRVPPRVGVCNKRYDVKAGTPGNDGSSAVEDICSPKKAEAPDFSKIEIAASPPSQSADTPADNSSSEIPPILRPSLRDLIDDVEVEDKREYGISYASEEAKVFLPDPEKLKTRISAAGFKRGAPVFMRIFKQEHVLEVWMKKGKIFERFVSYPICSWSGFLGPKQKEGDRQAPEGFYTVTRGQLNPNSQYHRSFNLGYPNLFDKSHKRTGSFLMVHGSCVSDGCYAMTDPVIAEIWTLINSAFDNGQRRFHVHAYPYRMTDENMTANSEHEWSDFWTNLKTGYDLFEETKVPPRVSVCDNLYDFRTGKQGSRGSSRLIKHCTVKTANN